MITKSLALLTLSLFITNSFMAHAQQSVVLEPPQSLKQVGYVKLSFTPKHKEALLKELGLRNESRASAWSQNMVLEKCLDNNCNKVEKVKQDLTGKMIPKSTIDDLADYAKQIYSTSGGIEIQFTLRPGLYNFKLNDMSERFMIANQTLYTLAISDVTLPNIEYGDYYFYLYFDANTPAYINNIFSDDTFYTRGLYGHDTGDHLANRKFFDSFCEAAVRAKVDTITTQRCISLQNKLSLGLTDMRSVLNIQKVNLTTASRTGFEIVTNKNNTSLMLAPNDPQIVKLLKANPSWFTHQITGDSYFAGKILFYSVQKIQFDSYTFWARENSLSLVLSGEYNVKYQNEAGQSALEPLVIKASSQPQSIELAIP